MVNCFVLTNKNSHQKFIVGKNCAIQAQRIIAQVEKGFSIELITEALDKILVLRNERGFKGENDEHDNFFEEFYDHDELMRIGLEEISMVVEEFSDGEFQHLYFEDDEYVGPEEENMPAGYDEYPSDYEEVD